MDSICEQQNEQVIVHVRHDIIKQHIVLHMDKQVAVQQIVIDIIVQREHVVKRNVQHDIEMEQH